MKATLILPTYNQYESLLIVLRYLSCQEADVNDYEVIIVDDGSIDKTQQLTNQDLRALFDGSISIVHLEKNSGRSVARNIGIEQASTNILIFCDSDRIPHPSFVRLHMEGHKSGQNIIVGASYDYFGKKDFLDASKESWIPIQKYARLPFYYKKVTRVFQGFCSNSPVVWVSLLIGNSSVKKDLIQKSGGFNPLFRDWGLEHFELGIRLRAIEPYFYLNPEAKNFHIPHSRDIDFYGESIQKSSKILSSLHPHIDCELVYEFLTTSMNVETFEKIILKTCHKYQ